MSKSTELAVGIYVMVGVALVGSVALSYKPSPPPGGDTSDRSITDWVRRYYRSIVAGAMAYGYYVAAALMAGAEFPKFLRDHLFDGLVPAALVAILIDVYPRANPTKAFLKIHRPVTMILIVFFIPGAVIFGLIGAAAVFSSGETNYIVPVLLTAWFGGLIFPTAYVEQIIVPDDNISIGETRWDRTKWWFKKRPPEVAEHPEPHVD